MEVVDPGWIVTVLFNFTSDDDDMPKGDQYLDPEALLVNRHKQPFTIALIIIYALNFTVGLVGNVFVILVILRHRHMRTLTNVFFLNLTVGDLMVVCVCLPITLGNYIYRDWVYGQAMCKLTPFLQGMAVGVSVLSMMSISLNRYFAILRPLRAKMVFSRGKVGVMLVLIWLLSAAAVCPLLVINHVTAYGLEGVFKARVCVERWGSQEARQFFNLLIFSLLFVLPLCLMAALYTRISMELFASDVHLFEAANNGKHSSGGGGGGMGGGGNAQASRLLRQRRKTVRSLILLVVLFGVSWLPFYVVNIWLDFNSGDYTAPQILTFIYPIVQVLGLSNSSANPLLYCFLSNGFRRAFANLCCRRKLRTHHGILVTLRYRCPLSDDSGVESIETVLS
ncbi:QRFP-like peptide receptor isoform X2 [Pomacea canaliculata]|uniref:QRFP-like peptide receptor isoform X2 n=1 Tax=Pomacea canaliculata TaxID=400727 RepID=UPI000D7378B0|nr:QRFP-like peptide receptor isoform X2 [Pomacea canaliculata]